MRRRDRRGPVGTQLRGSDGGSTTQRPAGEDLICFSAFRIAAVACRWGTDVGVPVREGQYGAARWEGELGTRRLEVCPPLLLPVCSGFRRFTLLFFWLVLLPLLLLTLFWEPTLLSRRWKLKLGTQGLL